MKKLLVGVMAFSVLMAFADKVVLKSGSTLTGTAGEAKNGVLKFNSEDLGEVEIKIANIISLENAGTHLIKFLDGHTESYPLSVEKGAYVVDNAPLDMSLVKEIDPPVETWHGSVNASYQADRGNTYGDSASILANVNRRWENDRVNADFGYYYSKTGTSKDDWEKSKDRIEAEGQYDHFWRTKFYSYLNARYERDAIAGLDRRVRFGAGLGYQWLEKCDFEATGKWSFNQELGAAWVNDKYENPDPNRADNYASLHYAHHLTYAPKWTDGLEFFHNFEYLPEVDDWTIYLFKADAGFTTMLFWNVDFLAKVEWDYNSKPSEDRKKSDFRYIIGLGYKW